MTRIGIVEQVVYEIDVPDDLPRDEWEEFWGNVEDPENYIVDVAGQDIEEISGYYSCRFLRGNLILMCGVLPA